MNKIFEQFPFINGQSIFSDREKVTWLVSAIVNEGDKDKLIQHFQNNQIDVRRFFYPLSEMPIYEKYLFSNKNAKYLSRRGINFPTHKEVDFKLITEVLECFSRDETS